MSLTIDEKNERKVRNSLCVPVAHTYWGNWDVHEIV